MTSRIHRVGEQSNWLLVSELLFLANLDVFFLVMGGKVVRGKKSSNDRWKEPAESVRACFSFVLTLCCRISLAASVTLRTAAARRSENDEDGRGKKTRLDCIWKQSQSRRCHGQNLPTVLWRLNYSEVTWIHGNNSSVSSGQFVFFLIATLTKRSRHAVWP